jgi:hypothetical protein
MKTTNARTPKRITVTTSTLSFPDPMTGTRAFDKPYPGVMLFRYDSGSLICANLTRPAEPGNKIYGKACGGYQEVLFKAGPGFFAIIDPPLFDIGSLTVEAAYRQIANMCGVLDQIGAFWIVRALDSKLARNLFADYDMIQWEVPQRTAHLIIANYEVTDVSVGTYDQPHCPKQLILK